MRALLLLAALAAVAPLGAQQDTTRRGTAPAKTAAKKAAKPAEKDAAPGAGHDMAGHAMPAGAMADHDMNAAGSGTFPTGWAARFDKADAKASEVSFTQGADGFHFVSGPAATYYMSGAPVDGEYTLSATFTQTKKPMHPEAYGLVAVGRNLETPQQSYVYFIVRGDGKFMIRHRANDTDLHTIMPWTESAAIVKADSVTGRATNKLAIAIKADSVRFLVNGTSVAAVPRSHMSDVRGVPGIRVNHNLDVIVSDWFVAKGQ